MEVRMSARTKTVKIVMIVIASLLVVTAVVIIALPSLLHAMGLHPDYTGQRYLLPYGKALIITTSHDELGEGSQKTGVFASEMTAPYYEFKGGRMYVDIASIKGGEIPIDPQSFNRLVRSDYEDRFEDDPVLQEKVKNSLLIDDIDFTEYDIIFLSGGWGAAYDLGYSEVLGEKITEAYAEGVVIGGVCHGLLGLLNAEDEKGNPLVEGRRITAVTDKQIREFGIETTPQHPERELRAAGADYRSETGFRDFFAGHVEIDGQIVSGQNQNDCPEVANLMMKVAGGSRR